MFAREHKIKAFGCVGFSSHSIRAPQLAVVTIIACVNSLWLEFPLIHNMFARDPKIKA